MDKPRVIPQHEYISVDFGNGRRLTTPFSGQKATGAVPHHVFKAWLAMTDAKDGTNFGERVQKFVDAIDTLWPEWNTPPKTFTVDQTVVFDFGPRRGGKKTGKIVKKNRTNYTIRFDDGSLIGINGDLLAKDN